MFTEEDLIKECKRYNKVAQMALYQKYAGKMNALCYRYLHSYDDAKDITQDGFVKVFSSINKFNGNGSFEGWIKRIMVNTTIDHLKKKRKHLFISIDNMETNEENTLSTNDEANEEESFEVELGTDLSWEQLMTLITKLPEVYGQVFNLYCIENYSHKEIAELLLIKESTSRSRLKRARIFLKEYLTEVLDKKRNVHLKAEEK
jgi:RNA polymerase sigma-70 factor, ECF subfamily